LKIFMRSAIWEKNKIVFNEDRIKK
jgi:hypothetical protein